MKERKLDGKVFLQTRKTRNIVIYLLKMTISKSKIKKIPILRHSNVSEMKKNPILRHSNVPKSQKSDKSKVRNEENFNFEALKCV